MFIMYHHAIVWCSSRFILVVYVFILVHLCFICVFARGHSAGDRSAGSSFEQAPPNGDAATEGSSSAADIVEARDAATTAIDNCEGHAATTASGNCECHAATSTASGQDVEEEDEEVGSCSTYMGSGRDSDDCRRSVP